TLNDQESKLRRRRWKPQKLRPADLPAIKPLLDKTSGNSKVPIRVKHCDRNVDPKKCFQMKNLSQEEKKASSLEVLVPCTLEHSRLPVSFLAKVLQEDEEAHKGKLDPSSNLDTCSKIIFPICFILFNCLYWSYYMLIVSDG
ncbi:hypothetical protein Ciccas_014540, partial [Cichlidogyrus casuarinus]